MARGKKKETLTPEERLQAALVPESEQPYKVPKNWCWVKLSSLSQVISKGTTPKGGKSAYSDHGVKFLRVENINDDGTISHENIAYVSEELHCTFLKRSILEENDILVSIAGTLGKTGIVRSVDLPMNTNQAVAFVRIALDKINRRYIKNAIDNPVIQNLLLGKTKVTSTPNLTLEIIGECPIPLPPFAEQQRIVDRIESLFSKLGEAKQKVQEALDSFETRKAAILHKAFTGELTAQWRKEHGVGMESWSWIPLKKCGSWNGGGTPSMSHPEYWENGTLLWVTSKDMKSDLIEDTLMHTNMLGVENSSATYIEEPAVLFVMRSGILRRIFPVCMVKKPFTVNQDLKALVPTVDINLEYLFWACKANEKQILEKCMKSGTTVESINTAALRDFEIPIARKNEQTEIVRILDDLLAKEQQAKEAAEGVLEQIDLIKKAILARAFRGELGTNDPTEENAEELLKALFEA